MENGPEVNAKQLFVNDREQLIYLLSEAAEIEHGLMCSYLYACWSLKRSCDEGLNREQLAAVDGWRDSMQSVAMEEMLHLALVSNLLMSIGSPPHFVRPNFPVAPGYHPASVVARLVPFTRATADHFVYLERPEGKDLPVADGFEPPFAYQRRHGRAKLTPTAEEYGTVSELYRGIEDGFRRLTQGLGEKRMFIGNPSAQVGPELLPFDGLIPVTNLESALAAVATIIEQGEGGREDGEDSHYARFIAIRDEYDALLRQDSAFNPCRPVVADPVMFPPIDARPTNHIMADPASSVLDIANGAYGLMLRLLSSGFSMAHGTAAVRRAEIDSAISVMSVVKTLGICLTTLEAGTEDERTAGMNFHLPRSTLTLPQPHASLAMLAERAKEVATALRAVQISGLEALRLAEQLDAVAARLENSQATSQ